jgi:hypothetical protein
MWRWALDKDNISSSSSKKEEEGRERHFRKRGQDRLSRDRKTLENTQIPKKLLSKIYL